MADAPGDGGISIISLRGGMNDTDPVGMIPDDQCLLALNVEFFLSACGERRAGCVAMSLTGSGINDMTGINSRVIVHISERFPTNDPNVGEVWVIGAIENVEGHSGSSVTATAYRSNESTWTAVVPDDSWDNTVPNIYRIIGQPWNTDHFLAGNTQTGGDRLHLWDGTYLRRTGQAPPLTGPIAADTGAGTYGNTIRYYRVRFSK